MFNYDRSTLSYVDQDRYKVKVELEKSICESSELKALIVEGNTYVFNYIYKDGTLTVTINSCK